MFDYAMCYNIKPFKMNNHNGRWTLIFQKKKTKKSLYCHMLKFDKWTKKDINMTLWL